MLITKEYQKQNELAHEDPEWGTTAHLYAELVKGVSDSIYAESILDYGAGKETLKDSLPMLNIFSYDPSIKKISKSPGRHDLVCCIDVLEHIEPECLEDVLDDLQDKMKKMGIFIISMVPAVKKLPDGRNAHLIVEDDRWWMEKILKRFHIAMMRNEKTAIVVMVTPLD